MKKSVAFLTLGCKVNAYETDGMEKLFTEAGYEIKDFKDKADVYVINTCTVTNIADRKSRQMLHRAKKNNPDGIVAAVGCYVQASKEMLEKEECVDIIIGNNEKKKIVELTEEFLANHKKQQAVISIGQEENYEEMEIASIGEKTRAYIKIQDGCNQFCSYCIIPYTRGRARSRKQTDILNEARRLAEKGYQEVVLTGIHLSSYGIDFSNKEMPLKEGIINDYQENGRFHNKFLLELIDDISKIDKIRRIRLGSLEPRIITEEFVKKLADNKKICPHFHLSLQSGCNTTLKRMNRKYTTEEYMEKCTLLRKYFTLPAITTDVIVGFPGETQDEFSQCKNFLRQVSFAQIHIFKYSRRNGTVADKMENQVPDELKHKRSIELMDLEKVLRNSYEQNFYGTREEIIAEESLEIDGCSYVTGHTSRYIKLAIPGNKNQSNQIIQGIVQKEKLGDCLICDIVK